MGSNGVRVGGGGSAPGLLKTRSATQHAWLHFQRLGIAYKRKGDHEPESEHATIPWH